MQEQFIVVALILAIVAFFVGRSTVHPRLKPLLETHIENDCQYWIISMAKDYTIDVGRYEMRPHLIVLRNMTTNEEPRLYRILMCNSKTINPGDVISGEDFKARLTYVPIKS